MPGARSFIWLYSSLGIVINMGFIAIVPVFEPFPFSLLTLVASLQAMFAFCACPHVAQSDARDADGARLSIYRLAGWPSKS